MNGPPRQSERWVGVRVWLGSGPPRQLQCLRQLHCCRKTLFCSPFRSQNIYHRDQTGSVCTIDLLSLGVFRLCSCRKSAHRQTCSQSICVQQDKCCLASLVRPDTSCEGRMKTCTKSVRWMEGLGVTHLNSAPRLV